MPLLDAMCGFIKSAIDIFRRRKLLFDNCRKVDLHTLSAFKHFSLCAVVKNILEYKSIRSVSPRDNIVSVLPLRDIIVSRVEAAEVETVKFPSDSKTCRLV